MLCPLLFVSALEALSRAIWAGYPENLLHADDLAIVSETMEDLKGRLEA